MILYVLILIVGLFAGSFLNKCIHRLPREEAILKSPSHCISCGGRLDARDAVPLFSFLLSKGRCRFCGVKIPAKYVVVELLTALVFILLYSKYGLSFYFFASAYLMSILITTFFIDLEHRIIPDQLVLAGLLGGAATAVFNYFVPIEIYGDKLWWNPLVGMFSGSGILFAIALMGIVIYKSDDAMGMGDVKIFAPIGVFLGWRMCLLSLLFSMFLAGIIGFVLIVTRIKKGKDTVPFGPFIVTAAFITLMWGWDIVKWYLN